MFEKIIHSFRIKIKIESHKKVCENKDSWNVIMPSKDIKMLECNQHQKSDKTSFNIYADLECIIKILTDVKIILKIHQQRK